MPFLNSLNQNNYWCIWCKRSRVEILTSLKGQKGWNVTSRRPKRENNAILNVMTHKSYIFMFMKLEHLDFFYLLEENFEFLKYMIYKRLDFNFYLFMSMRSKGGPWVDKTKTQCHFRSPWPKNIIFWYTWCKKDEISILTSQGQIGLRGAKTKNNTMT